MGRLVGFLSIVIMIVGALAYIFDWEFPMKNGAVKVFMFGVILNAISWEIGV